MAKKRKSTAKRKSPARATRGSGSPGTRICNLVESKKTETDWKYEDALAAGVLGAPAALPSSVDLRAAWWTIGEQENTGSCVGWATAEEPRAFSEAWTQRRSGGGHLPHLQY